MTPLKRVFFAAVILSAGFAVFYFFSSFLRPHEAVSKIRIRGFPSAFSLPGEILSQPVLRQTVISLEPPGLSSSALQKKIFHLLQHVKVSRGEAPEIFIIRYAHRDFARAAEVVNAIAVSFRDFYTERARAEISSLMAELDRELFVLEKEIFGLEAHLRKLQQESEPDEVDIQLALKFKTLEERYQELSKTFTGQYPEIIEIKREMESLKAQIMDASFHDPADIEKARLTLAESEASYRKLRLRRENLNLEMVKVDDSVDILAFSGNSRPFKYKK